MKYKTLRKRIGALLCVMTCLMCCLSLSASAFSYDNEEDVKKDETIEDIYNNHKELDPFTDPEKFAEKFGLVEEGSFDPKTYDYFYYNRSFIITISDSNVYDVTELVDVYFGKPGSGTITRTLPRYNVVADLNGVTTMGYPKYSGIYSDSSTTVTETDSEINIKLGNDLSGFTGFKQFRLHYTLDLGPDVMSGRDEALLYLIPPSADKPTLRCQFEIEMPKSFDEDKLSIACPGTKVEGLLEYEVDGLKIKGETFYHLDSNKSLVFRVKLPEGYFDNATRNYDTTALISLGAATLMVIVCTVMYLYSRSRNGKVHRLDYYPPKELNPLEAVYLKTGRLIDKKIPLLLPYLASRGCFKVTVLSKGTTGKLDKNSCGFIYTKNDGMPMLRGDERMFIEGMFGRKKKTPDGEPVSVHDDRLRGSFFRTIEGIKNYVRTDKTSVYRTFFQKGGMYMRLIYRIILSVLASIGIGLPLSYVGTGDSAQFSFLLFIAIAAGVSVGLLVLSLFNKAINIAVSSAIIFACIFFMPTTPHVVFASDIAVVTSLTAALILNIFTRDVDMVRTHYGKKLYDKLMGFERFIETSDTYKLGQLCEENNDYLYDILPYTQALGISLPRPRQLEEKYINRPPVWFETGDEVFSYFNMMYFYDASADDISYVPSNAASFDTSMIPPQILQGLNKKK